MYSYPFEKHTPSVFVVGTPFQALCAVEAIRDLEIEDYQFYVVFCHDIRDSQTIKLVETFNIPYTIVDKYDDILLYKKRLLIFKRKAEGYIRAFVGNFFSTMLYFWAIRSVSDNATIISLDDGTRTIQALKGDITCEQNRLNDIVVGLAVKWRKINLRKYFYTIYSDIDSRLFLCQPNNLSHVLLSDIDSKKNGVYFIGTNPFAYCEQNGLCEEQYYNLLKLSFRKVCSSYPQENKIYVPHGLDNDIYTKDICKEYGFIYERPDTIVELYLIQKKSYPIASFGLSSTALLNIKKMFSLSLVENICVKTPNGISKKFAIIRDYYSKNGIQDIILEV